MRLRITTASLLLVATMVFPARSADNADRMIVHEWGTFTTLQNDKGDELFGINIDDEPVPDFVHNLEPYILNTPVLSHDYWLTRQKGAPRFHPQVSMRLETPVIYFYPPANGKLPMEVDVQVKFRGGWLTEFYPNADVRLPDADQGKFDFTKLTRSTVGELAWRDLQVGTDGHGPQTADNVWLAPRRVEAVNVTNNENESEKYLFYRGVAQLNAPLRVSTSNDGAQLEFRGNFQEVLSTSQTKTIHNLWLMEARADGTSAYRRLSSVTVSNDKSQLLAQAARRFSEADFNAHNRGLLEKEMHDALVDDGLYADEATALLSTWQRAYFTSPGLRLFYLVPRVWTDYYLPLSISGDPEITRSMVGRIELISDQQKQTLARLAKADGIGAEWLDKIDWESPARRKLLEGRSNFGDLGVKIPPHFQLYLELGRFRNALVAAEEQRLGKRTSLTRFIEEYQLHPYRLTRN